MPPTLTTNLLLCSKAGAGHEPVDHINHTKAKSERDGGERGEREREKERERRREKEKREREKNI